MGALSHIRVLDLSRVLAGPWCTQNLADLGADVIKVEKPGEGDDTRHWGPPFARDQSGNDTAESAYFISINRNKRSITVDISKPEGQEIIRQLAKESDVVIENYKVGQLKKYGLDYDSLRQLKPDLIYCSITGFGQFGPYSKRPGYDFIVQGMGGFMSVTGEADGFPDASPQKAGVAIADIFTGMYATTSILAAIAYKNQTGEGQYIDLALLDTQVGVMANVASAY
jgi:formyl-CoA transferase